MNNPDQEMVLRAVEDARRILSEYIEPGACDATKTVERLLAVLDKNDLVHALDRINRRTVLRLVQGSLTVSCDGITKMTRYVAAVGSNATVPYGRMYPDTGAKASERDFRSLIYWGRNDRVGAELNFSSVCW